VPQNNKPMSITGLFLKNLPNLLTLLNMLFGLAVLYLCISEGGRDYPALSCHFILMAALLDAFDGSIARFLGTESGFGKQLDSFADLITFGLAPIAVLVTIEPIGATASLLFVLALYPVAGVFRLARFNLGDYTGYFVGLPITAAGFIQACFVLFLSHFKFSPQWVVVSAALLTTILSIMMVTPFKIRKFKGYGNRR
jgi:CDP-diacylglycerol--serine O-phosphatidyltransferase